MDFSTQLPKFSLNCPTDLVLENVKSSITRQLPQVQAYQPQDTVIGLVGGGPSLDIDEIREKYDSGVKMVSMNGTHGWLLDHGIRPTAHVQVDAREHNARFVENPQKETKYLIASQCPPEVFEALEGFNVHIWHGISTKAEIPILDEYYFGNYLHVMGGSTVMLRAFTLFAMLGYSHFEVFGFDSCYMDEDHHAYDQPENEELDRIHIKVGDREFACAPWMYSQAKDFIGQVGAIGKAWNMNIHGNGLIQHIVKTGVKQLEN